MPKLGIFSGQEVQQILESEGFHLVRQKGSHLIMQKLASFETVTVPVPNHKEIRTGTLLSIIRQSGVDRMKFTV